jgi:hypothetical protein
MHKSQSLFYLTTALHVSGVTITHCQEHKTTVTTESGNRYSVLLSAAIVEELELFVRVALEMYCHSLSIHHYFGKFLIATHNTLKPVPTLPR